MKTDKVSPLYRHPFVFCSAGLFRFGKKKLMRRIGEIVGSGQRVFDVACGLGRIREDLHPSCQYRGIDLNSTFVAYARARGRDVWLADVVSSPDYPESDVVIITDLFHHLSLIEIRIILRKAFIAAPRVIVVEPSYLGLARQKNILGKVFNWFFTFLDQDGINPKRTWFTEEEYRQAFQSIFGLDAKGVSVAIFKIGLSLMVVYEKEAA